MRTLLAALLVVFPLTSHAELLINADFEVPWEDGTEYIYNPDQTNSGMGWNFMGDSGVAKSGSAWKGVAVDGGQYAFIQRKGSSFSQSFSLNDAGSLSLSYLWSSRPQYPYGQNVLVTLQRGNYTYVIDDLYAYSRDWQTSAVSLGNLSAGEYRLTFSGYNDTTEDISAFIDNIELSRSAVDNGLGDMESLFAVPSPFSVGLIALIPILFNMRRGKLANTLA